jgi:hypothetical protein
MFKTACNSGVITLWGWPEFLLTGNGSRFASYLVYSCCNCCAAQQEGSRAMLCTYSLSCWQSDGQHWIFDSVQETLFGNWLLCLFSCTFPAPLVPRGLEPAQLPPTPWVCPNLPFLFFPLRSSSVFSLSLDCLGSRQPGWTQGEGLGSLWIYTCLCKRTK